MRIAILSCFYPYRGGIAQFNASLMAELGREHDVKAFNFKRQYPGLLFPGKTQYVTPDDEAVPVESDALLDTAAPWTYGRTARAIRRWQPDLVLLRYWMPYFAPSLGYVARHLGPGCKVIGILDNVVPHERRFFDRPLTRYFLGGCEGFVVMADTVRDDLLSFRPDARYLLRQHPLYAHFGEKLPREEAEDRLGIPHGGRNLLFFGLIRPYKGLDILIDAFSDLPDGYRLIVAGEPYGSFEPYQRQIDASPARDRIFLYPRYIRDSEVKDYFSAADVTVLPYRSATQSGISSVSYHFEVPMIVTSVGGLKTGIGDRGTGLTAAAATPEAVRTEILRYFSDPQVRAGCVARIREEKERLSWGQFARDLTAFASTLQNA